MIQSPSDSKMIPDRIIESYQVTLIKDYGVTNKFAIFLRLKVAKKLGIFKQLVRLIRNCFQILA